jgi:hypothetical protein
MLTNHFGDILGACVKAWAPSWYLKCPPRVSIDLKIAGALLTYQPRPTFYFTHPPLKLDGGQGPTSFSLILFLFRCGTP